MKTWIAFWLSLFGILGLIVFWKNSHTYQEKALPWRLGKSLADTGLILLAAFQLPALLVSWCVLWMVSPIKNAAARVTVAVFAGLLFGLLGATALELLVIASVFAIDLVTGRKGFLKNWYRARPPETAAAKAA